MAIKGATKSVDSGMSVEDFKKWLKTFDANNDGRISKEELQKAMRSVRVRFSTMKCGRGIRLADSDGDGYIDENEMENLVEFAQTYMNLKIAA
ncbi:EF-hand-containing protein [Dioscorea alata]|uniref:EF-hand-containing protein n=1 Tax=Dioscorea alata TaxID=55571 RepID=A0ACB7TXS5_DIOAL|nr:EF-hand-containing protein [Dioscorea alata]